MVLVFSLLLALGFSDDISLEQETKIRIEEILSSNPSSQKKVNLRTGVIQVTGNSPGIALNGDDTMPYIAAEWMHRYNNKWASELRLLHGQNLLYEPTNSKNESDAYFQTIDLGLRYLFEFDPTRKGNYFAFKFMYHQTQNNFELVNPLNEFLIQSYSGLSAGLERGVTITEKIHLNASLDLMYSLSVDEKSTLSVKENGYALFVRGEFHYLVDWFKRRGQVGLAYWHAAYTNEFDTASKVTSGKENFVTTYRLLSLSYTLMY